MMVAAARSTLTVPADVRIAGKIPPNIRTISDLTEYCEETFRDEMVVLEIDLDTLQAQYFGTKAHVLYVPKNEEALELRDKPAKIYAWYVDKDREEKIGRRLG